MASAQERIKNFVKDEEGAMAIEYAIMVSLIAVTIVVTVAVLGNQVKELFDRAVEMFPD